MQSCFSFWLENQLIQAVQEVVPKVESSNKINYKKIGKEVQRWVFAFVGIVTMICIIIVGVQMLYAEWNTEQMKAAMNGIFYIIVGLAVIPFAYFIIKLISSIRLW